MVVMSRFVPGGAFAFEATERSDEDALRSCLGQIVAARRGSDRAIAGIDRRRCDDGSSYATDLVTVTLEDGKELEVFVKCFGLSRYHKQEPWRQAEREIRVYRDVLARADLGTAEYCGALWDESRGRYWLFIEYVRGTPLAYREFECWIAAAGWLGRLHDRFAHGADPIHVIDVLLTHDASFFRSTAQRAVSAVATASPALADRLFELVCRYDACVDVMANQPQTLVHGAFKPRHVLVDDISEPRRLCPIDWELAATGSNLYDLAFLAHGVEPPALDRLIDAYGHEARVRDLSLPKRENMRYVIDCFRLHRILKALGRAHERAFPEERIAKAIESGERLCQLVC
jgi:aminoglycoside phosphotransferase (APT) family kinase protein